MGVVIHIDKRQLDIIHLHARQGFLSEKIQTRFPVYWSPLRGPIADLPYVQITIDPRQGFIVLNTMALASDAIEAACIPQTAIAVAYDTVRPVAVEIRIHQV